MIRSKKSTFSITLTVLSVLLLGACDDNLDEISDLKNELEEIERVNDLLLLKNLLLEAKIDEEPIIGFNTESGTVAGFELEERGVVEVDDNLILGVDTSSQVWLADITFSDSTSLSTFYLGGESGVSIEIELDAHGSAPLTAVVDIEAPIKSDVQVRVVGQDGEFSDITTSSDESARRHTFNVLGLYPGFQNTVEFRFFGAEGKERLTVVREITTAPLPPGFPAFEIKTPYTSDEEHTVFLVNFRPTSLPLMVDRFGKVRWYSTDFSSGSKYALQRFKNGNIGFGRSGNEQGSVFEYSITGELVREYSFYPEFENAHHDVFELSNGNLLVAVNKVGEPTIEDYIIELDRNSGAVTNVWDLNQVLPKRGTFINDPVDWVHVNAVIHDERDNSLIISGQRQGLFKVTWDNQLKWILAPPFGWEGYEGYLLSSNDPDMDWNWGQHAPVLTPDGNLLFFDNGYGREFGNAENFSRAMEVKIVESEVGGSVETVWEFGRERGDDFFSPIISDVDYLEDSQTRLIVAGSLAFVNTYSDKDNISNSWSDDPLKAAIVEVDDDKNVLFEMHITSDISNASVYRAEKLKLY